MAKKQKLVQRTDTSEIDTSEGGLLTTGMQAVELSDVQVAQEPPVDEDGMPMDENLLPEVSDVVVSADVPRDPSQTIAACLMAIGRMWEDAGKVSVALSKWIPTVAAEPELHAFLQRMSVSFGDFRHSIQQNEALVSDALREAIVQGVS